MISSKQNSLIKEIRSLRDKKNRDNLGVFVVEGLKPVKEALELSLDIREIVCTENKAEQFLDCPFKVETVTDEVFNYISEDGEVSSYSLNEYDKNGNPVRHAEEYVYSEVIYKSEGTYPSGR